MSWRMWSLHSGILAKIRKPKKFHFKATNFHEGLKIEHKSLVTLLHGAINHPILAPSIGNLIGSSSFQQKQSLKDLLVINRARSKSFDGNMKKVAFQDLVVFCFQCKQGSGMINLRFRLRLLTHHWGKKMRTRMMMKTMVVVMVMMSARKKEEELKEQVSQMNFPWARTQLQIVLLLRINFGNFYSPIKQSTHLLYHTWIENVDTSMRVEILQFCFVGSNRSIIHQTLPSWCKIQTVRDTKFEWKHIVRKRWASKINITNEIPGVPKIKITNEIAEFPKSI